MMDDNRLIELVNEYIPQPDPNAVALYVIARTSLLRAAEQSTVLNKRSVPMVSPEALRLMMDYDTGLTNNEFYIANWASIRTLMNMEVIELNSLRTHLQRTDTTNQGDTHRSKLVVRDLATPKYQALTHIVCITDGIGVAKKFDFMLKEITTISPEYEEYFRRLGV